ncbi:helix-turn-helix domain-containing protein [uncultured Chryseobacterium sp.]|uniref:helix-turn-helix domain-containing protein n=1 Tax=uncultured Chryseobacterium sp. TaxID=259322 RepID=UPI0025E6F813|nr:helix-turn-helix domain-containing protein [uncultured Chryseobacterium sp.]
MEVANRKIVEYIRDTWVIPMNNNSRFATENNIDEKTVRRIREDDTYQISLITIMRICEAQNIKLSKFFEMAGL